MSIKKVFGLAVLLAALAFTTNVANAATAQELQDQINALLAQIGSLQGGSSTSCYSFTRDLTVGSQGADVTALQNYLAAKGYFNVAATGYFGAITAQAAASWQSANGVMPAAGYFGAISRAKYNSMCSSTTPTTGDDDDDSDSDFGGSTGEEASLEDFDVKDGDDTSLEEGQEDAEVMEIEFDVEDSDVEIQRVEIVASSSAGNGEEDPWDVFESATLWIGGDDVATIDNLDDEDEWDERSDDGEYTFRFNGIDTVVDMGETAELVLSVTLQDNLDELDESWDLWVAEDGIRALDEAGIDQYLPETEVSGDVVSIDIEAAGGDDELQLSESDDNPEATTLGVEADEKSDWHTLAIMDLEADTETEVKDFKFRVLINEAGADTTFYSSVVSDLVLVIDGEEYDDFTVSGEGTATATVTFDLSDEDIVIGEGDEVAVEVQAEFNATSSNYAEGTTVTVDVPSATFQAIDAEGVDSGEDLAAGQLDGSFEGEVMTLRSEGLVLALVNTEAVSPVGADEAQASYEIEFTVEAFGEDFFIEKETARDASGDTAEGVNYVIENGSGAEYASTSATVAGSLSKDGSTTGDTATHYKVSEGQTRTFTLLVTLDNEGASAEGADYYRLALTGVAFDLDGTGGTADGGVVTTGLDEFETDEVFVDDADANN